MSRTRQPKRGDLVVHCGHLCGHYECGEACVRGFHWYEGRTFTRDDGTSGVAQWVVICQRCLMQHGPEATPLVGERRWNASRRVIVEIGEAG